MSTWSDCSTTGRTSTPAKEVWRRPWLSKGEMRTRRCALLDGEGAVGVRRVHGEGGRLDAGLFGVRRLDQLGLVAALLGPAQVHALELLGEVGGVDATGLGADVDERLTGVVLAGQEGTDLHLVQRLADGGQLGLGLGAGVRVVLLLGHLEEDREVVDPAAQRLRLPHLGLEVGELAGDLLRLVRVVPQGRGPPPAPQARRFVPSSHRGPGRPRSTPWSRRGTSALRIHRRLPRLPA